MKLVFLCHKVLRTLHETVHLTRKRLIKTVALQWQPKYSFAYQSNHFSSVQCHN